MTRPQPSPRPQSSHRAAPAQNTTAQDRVVLRRLLPGYEATSPVVTHGLGWFLFVALLMFLAGLLPPDVFIPGSSSFLLIMGMIGIWRYSWGALHFYRSFLFQRLVFPRIRARADACTAPPPHLYCVVTSFRVAAEVNAMVYRRLVEEIRDYGNARATIVACITDPADLDILQRVVARATSSAAAGRVRLLAVPQRGRGKRDAMADALDIIAADYPLPGSQVILMDGDSLLGRGSLRKACSILLSEADIGAVTTENHPLVKGGTVAREWYRLRMAQRHNLMCSLSLSRKVLVLTGRFSVFRAEIACRPDFSLAVRRDSLRHWRLGQITMLTGDDKSTWFAVLKSGWNMLYVPDAVIHPLEEPPLGAGFLTGSVSLMTRWFGNMVRNNGRALALGPRRTGWFLWLCLLDQRLSMWTTLTGPTFATLASLLHSSVFLLVYLFWVIATRSLYCLLLSLTTGRLHPLFPLLLYYSQFVGSIVKVVATFFPYRQKWTRQKIAHRTDPMDVIRGLTSGAYAVVTFLLFILFVGYASDLLHRDVNHSTTDILAVDEAETTP